MSCRTVSSLEPGRIVRALKTGLCGGRPQPLQTPCAPTPLPGANFWARRDGAASAGQRVEPGAPLGGSATPLWAASFARGPAPAALGPVPLLQRNLLRTSGQRAGVGRASRGLQIGAASRRASQGDAAGPRRPWRRPGLGPWPVWGACCSPALPSAPPILPHVPPPAFQILKMFPPATEKCPNQL